MRTTVNETSQAASPTRYPAAQAAQEPARRPAPPQAAQAPRPPGMSAAMWHMVGLPVGTQDSEPAWLADDAPGWHPFP